MYRLLNTGLLGLCLFGGVLRGAESPLPPSGIEITEVVTGKGGENFLHAKISTPRVRPPTAMPAVIFIHGGGWASGSHQNQQAEWLVAHGYLVASIEYRLTGEAKWPAQIEDCKLGVRWLRANAAKYGVNPDRIGCYGTSAGAHLAACLGTMGDQKQWEGEGGYPGVSSEVQAVVDLFGCSDLTSTDDNFGGAKGVGSKSIEALIGASFEQKPQAWKAASPLFHVRPGLPPFILIHGDIDLSVPFAQSVKLAAALKEAHVPVELVKITGAGHNLHPPAGAPPEAPGQKVWRQMILDFLDRNLKPAL